MQLLQSAVGRKLLMAITGFMMIAFLISHLIGNSTVWGGPDWLNSYAEHLHSVPPLVWILSIILLVIFIFHIFLGITLTLENWKARPVNNSQTRYLRSSISSRTMIYTGILILAFVAYHLLHFTFQVIYPDISFSNLAPDHMGRHDLFSMMVLGFQNLSIAFIYVAGLIALFIHLYHGIASFFQTMGWNNNKTLPIIEFLSKGLALVILAGFIFIPIAIIVGLVNI